MPAFNSERFLEASVNSILSQSYTDFEFIAINDGSSDKTGEILDSFNDPRMRVIHNEHNLGISGSLNKALKQARGEFVARHDADDISLPQRLEKQVAFLDRHPEVGILSTYGRFIDEAGRLKRQTLVKPLDDISIRWHCLLSSPFMHNTVVWRRELWEKHNLTYDEDRLSGQDFDLWYRVLNCMQGANLAEPLVLYRLHSTMNTVRLRPQQLSNHNRAVVRNLKEQFGMEVSLEQANLLSCLYGPGGEEVPDLDAHRAEITPLYLEMLSGFAKKYKDHAGIGKIKIRVFRKVFMTLVRKPLKNENIRLLSNLVACL